MIRGILSRQPSCARLLQSFGVRTLRPSHSGMDRRNSWQSIQQELSGQVISYDTVEWSLHTTEGKVPLKLIGGVDISFYAAVDSTTQDINGSHQEQAVASLVVLSYPELSVVYEDYEEVDLSIPYIPGFLGFRECPAFLQLLERVRGTPMYPQVLLVDGYGTLHPNGCGSASQLGVLADIPTIGVAKKVLAVDGLERQDVRSAMAAAQAPQPPPPTSTPTQTANPTPHPPPTPTTDTHHPQALHLDTCHPSVASTSPPTPGATPRHPTAGAGPSGLVVADAYLPSAASTSAPTVAATTPHPSAGTGPSGLVVGAATPSSAASESALHGAGYVLSTSSAADACHCSAASTSIGLASGSSDSGDVVAEGQADVARSRSSVWAGSGDAVGGAVEMDSTSTGGGRSAEAELADATGSRSAHDMDTAGMQVGVHGSKLATKTAETDSPRIEAASTHGHDLAGDAVARCGHAQPLEATACTDGAGDQAQPATEQINILQQTTAWADGTGSQAQQEAAQTGYPAGSKPRGRRAAKVEAAAGEVLLLGASGKVLGVAYCPGGTKKPIYISVGHRVGLETAVQLVKLCCKHRIPEPIRQADLRSRDYIRQRQAAAVASSASSPP